MKKGLSHEGRNSFMRQSFLITVNVWTLAPIRARTEVRVLCQSITLVQRLPFFTEVCQTQRSRRLGFALATETDDNENGNGDEVGNHLIQ